MSPKVTTSRSRLTRRTALGGVGVAAAALSLRTLHPAAAQEATPDAMTRMLAMASHPIVGAWMITGSLPVPWTFSADGTTITGATPNYVDPTLGLTFQTPLMGVWEPLSEREIRFTVMQTLTDAQGTFAGTFLIDSHPLVSADGQSFTDNSGETRLVMRDANNVVLLDDTIAAGMTAVRITLGSLVLPMATESATPVAGTPTS